MSSPLVWFRTIQRTSYWFGPECSCEKLQHIYTRLGQNFQFSFPWKESNL